MGMKRKAPSKSSLGSSYKPDTQSLTQTNPSSASSVNYLLLLPSALFAYVCGFLVLDTKCRTLSRLSHGVKAAFNPATCCQHDHLIDFITNTNGGINQTALKRCVGRSRYIEYAKSVDATFWKINDCRVPEDKPDHPLNLLPKRLAEAIRGPYLQSLKFNEVLEFEESAILPIVLDTMKQRTPDQLLNLHTISMDISREYDAASTKELFAHELVDDPDASMPPGIPELVDWSALSNCGSLTSFKLRMETTFEVLESIIRFLPSSIKKLSFPLAWDSDDRDFLVAPLLTRLLKDPELLPNLELIEAPELDDCDSLATVMSLTGRSRPLFKLCVTMNKTIQFSSFGGLQQIKVVLNAEKLSEFCDMPDAALPQLTSIDIEILPSEENTAVDLSSVLFWSSKRPIEKFHLVNPVVECAPLTVDAVLAWSRMSSLQEMHWVYKPKPAELPHIPIHFFAAPFIQPHPDAASWFDNLDQLPRDCWPKLQSLKFHSRGITNKQLIMLVKACSYVKQLDLGEPDHSLVLMLPEIGHICRDVESITLSSSRRREPVRVKLQEAFALFPVKTDTHISFRLLNHLHFDEELAPDVLHYLISQLAESTPLLSLTETDFHEKLFHLRILLKEKLLDLEYLSWWERTLVDQVLPKKANSNKDFERDQNNNEIMTEHGYKFRQSLKKGLNGRDDFFCRISDFVMEEHHQGLEQWDAGDYTWQMPEASGEDGDYDYEDENDYDDDEEDYDDDRSQYNNDEEKQFDDEDDGDDENENEEEWT